MTQSALAYRLSPVVLLLVLSTLNILGDFCMLTFTFVANICWPTLSLSLQTNLTESQQSCSSKEDQLQHLSLELISAQANATDLAKVHEEKEQQFQQQKALLKKVQAQSAFGFNCCLLPIAGLHFSLGGCVCSSCMQVLYSLQLLCLLLPWLCKRRAGKNLHSYVQTSVVICRLRHCSR